MGDKDVHVHLASSLREELQLTYNISAVPLPFRFPLSYDIDVRL